MSSPAQSKQTLTSTWAALGMSWPVHSGQESFNGNVLSTPSPSGSSHGKSRREFQWCYTENVVMSGEKTMFSLNSYQEALSPLRMWELDYKESWALRNWYFWTVVLEKTLESPLDSKEIQPVYPKGNHPWIFIGRTDAEAETPILWPPDAKNWFTRKDPDAGKDWRQEKKGTTEDEMLRWHYQLNGYEFE